MATEYTAKLNYLRMAPRKVRSVADLIRGLSVNNAEAQLLVQRRRPSKAILKLLRSAVANAKNNKQLNLEYLFVSSIRVDQGPMLKRMLPRARGSASPIQKKMSHVTIVLGVNEKLASKFKIVPPKRTKLPPGEDRPIKEKRQPRGEKETAEQKKKSGFFKRIFNRKAGFAK